MLDSDLGGTLPHSSERYTPNARPEACVVTSGAVRRVVTGPDGCGTLAIRGAAKIAKAIVLIYGELGSN
jgi:hypothetical protein